MGRLRLLLLACPLAVVLAQASPGVAGTNIRVTNDNDTSYVSADVMGGTGTYSDDTLKRCGHDRRTQNEPAIAIDPRDTRVRTSGSNDYCPLPITGDAWAGFYRSFTSGTTWTDSLLPGYLTDNSPQGLASPLHQMALGGAKAAGDPVQAWDLHGNLFYMGNNFNRGVHDGNSPTSFRDNTGDVWVATYSPSVSTNTLTDGSKYVRTVILATNTFGQGSFNDKTGIQVDQTSSRFSGNVYAAWSDFHGRGCNEILFSRSTDHGATFSAPMKISTICNNQGPNIAIGNGGQVYVSWIANTGGTKSQGSNFVQGAAFAASLDGGATFSKDSIVVRYTPFVSGVFSGNGARECGDAPLNCPSGQTFPRFDLATPSLTTDVTDTTAAAAGGAIYMAFQVAQPSGQGQIQWTKSTDGGASWTSPSALDPQTTGHQYFPWITASGGRLSAVYYDSRDDAHYSALRAPCNDVNGNGYPCLDVWYSTSTNGGATWSHSKLTDSPFNPNYEQFSGRTVPFLGDYIMVSSVFNGSTGWSIQAAWTDQRDTVPAPTGNADGNDVAGDPHTGGTPSCGVFTTCFDGTGGLDQNIYSAIVS